jgi:hypothetical protein
MKIKIKVHLTQRKNALTSINFSDPFTPAAKMNQVIQHSSVSVPR